MKILITIILFFWMIFTLLLAISALGLIVLEANDSWYEIGKKLTNKLLEWHSVKHVSTHYGAI